MTDHCANPVVPPNTPRPRSTHSSRAFVAGAAGAGLALALGELFAGFSRRVPSLVVAVADVAIRQADADTAGTAIELFGTNDKPALLIGIVVVGIVIGAVAARIAVRRPVALGWTYASFGAFGAWAATQSPLSSAVLGGASAAFSAFGGWISTTWLLRRASAIEPTAVSSASLVGARDPQVAVDRRRFVTGTVTVGASAIAGVSIGRTLRSYNTVEGERAEVAQQLVAGHSAVPISLDGPAAQVEGISSYITPARDFYRIDTSAEVPQIDPTRWFLKIDGLVDTPLELTLDDILAEDLVDRTVTISCVSNTVGGNLAGTATWTGMPLETLFERAGVQADATQVVGRSFTGWTAGFPRSVVADGRTTLVAVAMNGEPLPIKNGFPARLIVAGLYGYVSATKWLSQIELTRWDDFDGYWVERGWAKNGPMKITSRIDVPSSGDRLPAGLVVLAGVAWAPTVGISGVEVWLDSVGEWIPSELGDTVSGETWVQWSVAVDAGPGTQVARVRAIDAGGTLQPEGPQPTFPDGAEGYHRIRFDTV